MIITFYGVRGSTAAPGPLTQKYGGNTSCVHIELESGHDLILDAGTGIRLLGNRLAKKSTPANILLSHGHWDHIQGYPFFAPIYQPDRDIHVYISVEKGRKLLSTLFQQMDGTHFPIRAEDLPSNNFPKFKGIESELYEREGVRVIEFHREERNLEDAFIDILGKIEAGDVPLAAAQPASPPPNPPPQADA